jgi:hyaluronan synthase
LAFARLLFIDPYFTAYGLLVTTYILSRFVLSSFYRARQPAPAETIEPRVAVVMPAYNERDAIQMSIDAVMAGDYPSQKLEVVLVDDGSTDGTGAAADRLATQHPTLHVIHFETNQGKRAAMAAGIASTTAEIVAVVDSDSVLAPDAIRTIVQDFDDPEVGAVAGRADVFNAGKSWITRMQTVRYYVAFQVMKAAESVFGAVTCCSGCFAAYRRSAIAPHLNAWVTQRFLGARTTYGDDRSMTNRVLRDWKVVYQARAVSSTIVPVGLRPFLRQQLRWKRSWARESTIVARFIWRKNPAAAAATFASIALSLLAPVTVVRAVLWRPLFQGAGAPILYLVGIYAVALIYGLYYQARRGDLDGVWLFGVLFVFFYLAFMVWQNYYAILTVRNPEWGTRPSTHAVPEPAIHGATPEPAT